MAPINLDERLIITKVFREIGAFTLFDVGAAEGEYTEGVRSLTGFTKAHLFEPRSLAAEALRVSYLNDPDVFVKGCAVGNFNGEAELTLGRDDLQQSHLRGSFPGEQTEQVEMITLDSYIDNGPFYSPIFLKIDTEGFEMPVMNGAINAIKTRQIPAVQFEYGGTWPGAWRLQDAVDLLEGFTIFEMKEDELRPITSTEDDYVYRNYLALACS